MRLEQRVFTLATLLGVVFLLSACGRDGVDGTRCTVAAVDGMSRLECDDGTFVELPTMGPDGQPGTPGAPGAPGAPGEPGVSCTVSVTPEGATAIACTDGTSVEVPAGSSCGVMANPDGSATITCEDGTSADIGRPTPPTGEPSLEALAGVTSVGSNDGLATETRMDGALHAAFSPDGNYLYFVDTFNLTIRRFGLVSGRVVTLAGSPGLEGVSDGIGSAARFQGPRGITIDPSGETLFIADGFNCTIRTLDVATNEVRTLIGVPRACGFADGSFAEARLGLTIGMAMRDERYVYFADRGAHRIRRIDLQEERVETVAGGARGYADGLGAEARLDGPGGIDFDDTGTWLWVNDTFNQTIRRIALTETDAEGASTFRVETVAGRQGSAGHVDGPGADARFSVSQGLTWARDGVYVAGFHDTIRRIAPVAPFTVTTVAGRSGRSGSADGHPLAARFGVAFGIHAHPDGERVYYMDRGNNNIRELNLTTQRVTTVMGAPQPTDWRDGPGLDARFRTPAAVLPSADGRFLYLADQLNHVVRRYDTGTRRVETLAGLPNVAGYRDGAADSALFDQPVALALSADGRTLWISEWNNRAVRALDTETLEVRTLTGGPARTVVLEGGAVAADTVLEGPLDEVSWGRITGLALDAASGRLFASDYTLNTVRVIDLAAESVSTLAGGGSVPRVPQLDAEGNPVLDAEGNPVLVPATMYEVDGEGAAAIFVGPYGLALSADGATLFVADRLHHLVRSVDTSTGRVTTIAGEYGVAGAFDDIGLDAGFTRPSSVALSGDGRRLYVVDAGNHAVRRIELATRAVDTVVGELGISGGFGFQFTPLRIARLYFPAFVATDGDDLILSAQNVIYRGHGVAAAPAVP